jgi:hypothetical protein
MGNAKWVVVLGVFALAIVGACSTTGSAPPVETEWKASTFFIELTQDDIEVQSFVDATRWQEYRITDATGDAVLEFSTAGPMAEQGISEVKVDGHPSHYPVLGEFEPEVEAPEGFLRQFAVGAYRFDATYVDGRTLNGATDFTHRVPAIPQIVWPGDADEPMVTQDAEARIRWNPVVESTDGNPLDITGYEIIVEEAGAPMKLSVFLPAEATEFVVPGEFLRPDAVYDVEVVAIEQTNNQSIAVSQFRTSAEAEEPDDVPTPLDQWKKKTFFIELTEDDIEVQSFVDAQRWTDLRIIDPNGTEVVRVATGGVMAEQGLSELKIDGHPSHFPIQNDPAHLEIASVDVFLDQFRAGSYEFIGTTHDGTRIHGTTDFTHTMPANPRIVSPSPNRRNPVRLDLDDAVIEWESVTSDYFGDPIEIVRYEVIVEQVEPFRRMNLFLPATQTTFRVPPEFLEPGRVYDVEVVAIEESANQSISVSEFRT